MNSTQLVPVFTGEIQGEMRQICNARDLHGFLEVGRDFSTWFKGQVDEFSFVEGEAFYSVLSKRVVCSPDSGSKQGRGGYNRIDYHLTLDMAKELAMVENNDKGRMVRRYFIEVEKRAQQTFTRGLPSVTQQLSAHGVRLRLLDKLEILTSGEDGLKETA